MDDLVTHADDVCPGDLRMLLGEFQGNLARRFSDDLDEMNQREAKILVRVVRLAREALSLADGLPRHVEHVPDVYEVTRRHREVQRCPRT